MNDLQICGAGVRLSGTVTYSTDGRTLGTSTEPPPYSVDLPVEVTL